MSVANSPPLTNSLADLAERSANLHLEYQTHREESAACYVAFGQLLNEAKRECRHGQWLPFLERAGIPKRTAQRSMRIARAIRCKCVTVTHLAENGITATLHELPKWHPRLEDVFDNWPGIMDRWNEDVVQEVVGDYLDITDRVWAWARNRCEAEAPTQAEFTWCLSVEGLFAREFGT